MRRERRWRAAAKLALGLILAALVLYCFSTGLKRLESGHGEEGRRQLEDAIRRAAVACYAAEGIYPPDVAYLEEHYGIQIQHEAYTVFYDVFASNMMPEIAVVENT